MKDNAMTASNARPASPGFVKNWFDVSNLRGDLMGGVTAGVVALPLALAFGEASGAGPIAGLWGAIFVGFFAALFGGTGAVGVVLAAIAFTKQIADIQTSALRDGDQSAFAPEERKLLDAANGKVALFDFAGAP